MTNMVPIGDGEYARGSSSCAAAPDEVVARTTAAIVDKMGRRIHFASIAFSFLRQIGDAASKDFADCSLVAQSGEVLRMIDVECGPSQINLTNRFSSTFHDRSRANIAHKHLEARKQS